MGEAQYNSICLIGTKPSYNNIKTKNHGPLLIPVLGNRGQGISEFEASLVYRATFRTSRATQTNLVFRNKQTKMKTVSYQTVLVSNST